MSTARHRLVAVVVGVLVALAAGLSLCTPMLHASNDAQALRTDASSIHAPSLTAPLDMVVPSHGARAEWRLKPVLGLGGATAVDRPTAPLVEIGTHHHRLAPSGPTGETLRTRAPPA